jgi:hypothetical protein
MLPTRQARYALPRYRNIPGDPIVALLDGVADEWFDDGYCCRRPPQKEKE